MVSKLAVTLAALFATLALAGGAVAETPPAATDRTAIEGELPALDTTADKRRHHRGHRRHRGHGRRGHDGRRHHRGRGHDRRHGRNRGHRRNRCITVRNEQFNKGGVSRVRNEDFGPRQRRCR